jgi:hypothetical protein
MVGRVSRDGVRSAGRRRWLGQFLGQSIGDVRGEAGNPWGLAFGFKGQTPGRTRADVIIKCRAFRERDSEMQNPEGSRLRGFYFRLHPLMPGERDGEDTSVKSVIHYCDR